MTRLGSKKRPAIVRVQTQERADQLMDIFRDHDWDFIIGVEPDNDEDITDRAGDRAAKQHYFDEQRRDIGDQDEAARNNAARSADSRWTRIRAWFRRLVSR